MKSLLYGLFGVYTPIVYETSEGVEIIPNGLAGVDIPYLIGCVLFGICLWQFLAMVRGLLNRD